MQITKNLPKILIILLVITMAIVVLSFDSTAFALAETKEYQITFYSDKDVVFETVTTVEGKYVIPQAQPTKENMEFLGWVIEYDIDDESKGNLGGYLAQGTQYVATSDMSIKASWKPIEDLSHEDTDGWNPDPILLTLVIVAVIVVLIMFFVMYWCGFRRKKISELYKRKKKDSL